MNPMKGNTFYSKDMLQGYSELCAGIFALRLEDVKSVMLRVETIGFKSRDSGKFHHINIKKMYENIPLSGDRKDLTAREAFTHVTNIHIIAFWDMLKDKSVYSSVCNNPVVQYFRHIRNAAAHGNKFNITSDLIKLAEWNGRKIERSMHGEECVPKHFGPYDFLVLISDVNNIYASQNSEVA